MRPLYHRVRCTSTDASLKMVMPRNSEHSPDESQLLLKGGLVRVTAYVAMILFSVAWTAVLTRKLGIARFGIYTSALSVATVLTALADAGMGNFATREYASREGADRARFTAAIFGLRVASATFGIAMGLAFALVAGYPLPVLLGVIAATAAMLPLVASHTMWLPLINDLRFGLIAGLELFRQALWGVLLVVLALTGFGLLPLMASLLAANLALLGVTLWASQSIDRPRLTLHPRAWPALMQEAAAFSAATAVGTIYVYTAQIVTSLVTSPHQTGLFSVSFRVVAATATIPALVSSSALPVLARAARDDLERMRHVTKRLIEISAAGGLGFALAMSAGAGFIVSLLGGTKFEAATGVLQLQALAMVATFTLTPCSFALLGSGQYRSMLWANGIALMVTILATAALADVFGAVGSAMASVCGELTLALLIVGSLLRRQPEARPDGRVMVRLGLAIACAAPIALLPVLPSLPRAAAFSCVYLVLLLALRVLPPEVTASLKAGHEYARKFLDARITG